MEVGIFGKVFNRKPGKGGDEGRKAKETEKVKTLSELASIAFCNKWSGEFRTTAISIGVYYE